MNRPKPSLIRVDYRTNSIYPCIPMLYESSPKTLSKLHES